MKRLERVHSTDRAVGAGLLGLGSTVTALVVVLFTRHGFTGPGHGRWLMVGALGFLLVVLGHELPQALFIDFGRGLLVARRGLILRRTREVPFSSVRSVQVRGQAIQIELDQDSIEVPGDGELELRAALLGRAISRRP